MTLKPTPIGFNQTEEEEYEMYFDNEKRNARLRSNDEFFRRMRGEDFAAGPLGNDVQTFSQAGVPSNNERPRTSCDGTPNVQFEGGTHGNITCSMPSLAMVYAPIQPWSNLLSPQEGLLQGSIFSDLILPFEASSFAFEDTMEGGHLR